MLPPGHIAAGYLTGYALLKIAKPDLDPQQLNQLLWWACFFGFAPDLDYFWAFAKEQAFIIRDVKTNNHRTLVTHAPLLWLAAGLAIYFFSASVYFKTFGLILWLASWSHFLLDSVEYGVMWLWPFSNKLFALRKLKMVKITASGFWQYWWEVFKILAGNVSLYLEIITIIIALTIFMRY